MTNDESENKSPEIMKVFCSIGNQTEDSSSTCDSFEEVIPYQKPMIQDFQMFQIPKDVFRRKMLNL